MCCIGNWRSRSGQDKLETARAQLEKAAADEAARAAVAKAEAYVDFAEDKLADAKETYLDEYVPADVRDQG